MSNLLCVKCAVVGAGIAGLSCALQLARAGKKVVVLEARVRGGGQVRCLFNEDFHKTFGPIV